ncbi:hypothetical protein ACSBR2_010456 [Camellia fascicularis]
MVNTMAFMGHQWAQQHQAGAGMSQIGFAMAIAASMVVMTMFQQFLTTQLRGYVEKWIHKLVNSVNPFVKIKFHEDTFTGGPKNHEAFSAIETYLSDHCASQAPRLKANAVRDIQTPVLCVDDGVEVSDDFQGIKVSWNLIVESEKNDSFRGGSKKNKHYTLNFRKMNREIVVGKYLKHVMEKGKAAAARNRQRKLYSNSSSEHGTYWNYIMEFDHPASFDTIAMEESKKQDIIADLRSFSESRDYYRRIGKPWKRGYLLHGPPGTGKSTMIAAMANALNYDVYDLELTAVTSNANLKKLLNRTPCNSILVIEDIDCSSDISGLREKKLSDDKDKEKEKVKFEKVTLSALLNCIDGLFSANEGGRVMVFTTNHVEKLDPALIRRGRMDKHIEMSFCRFEAFKVLAKNYLGIENHELFPQIERLLKQTDITPADVAENLITKNADEGSARACLQTLIDVLEKKLEEDKVKLLKAEEKAELVEPPKRAMKENGTCIKQNGHVLLSVQV